MLGVTGKDGETWRWTLHAGCNWEGRGDMAVDTACWV